MHQKGSKEWELDIWTIYDHPRDFPEHYVARRYVLEKATQDFIVNKSVEQIREIMLKKGLCKMPRDSGDDPCIVECWF